MVFSSYLFLFWFLPFSLVLYYSVKGRWRHALLTLISYLFYGWTNPLFVLLLFLSTCIDYLCGLVLMKFPPLSGDGVLLQRGGARSRMQKSALTLSLLSNLGLLAFFKYGNFGIDNWNCLINSLHLSETFLVPSLNIILPLGISFYTFQSMSYTIDVYRGDAKGVTSFVDFACYVSMFPQLVAGPIIRFQEIADQLRNRIYSYERFARGVAFFIIGFGQKILLANPNGKIADFAFEATGLSLSEAWFGITAYALQIFFDFAGYSNMAIGLGLMLGFVFPMNFDYPYRSCSVTEFWRRWHISLSSWLRDYLYIPLGGNRRGVVRTYINLMLVMLLGGLWHGASWNFVIWGAIHGSALVVERLCGVSLTYGRYRLLRWMYTVLIILFAWVFFRASDLPSSLRYIVSLLGMGERNAYSSLVDCMMFTPYLSLNWFLSILLVFSAPAAWSWTRVLDVKKWCGLFLLFVLAAIVLIAQSYNPFIYFIF